MTVSSLSQYIAVNLYKRDKRGRLPPSTIFPVSFFPKKGPDLLLAKDNKQYFSIQSAENARLRGEGSWPGLSSFEIVVFSLHLQLLNVNELDNITKLSKINWFWYNLVKYKILEFSCFIYLDKALVFSHVGHWFCKPGLHLICKTTGNNISFMSCSCWDY